MTMSKTLPSLVLVYGLWFVFTALGILFLILSWYGFTAILNLYLVPPSLDAPNQVAFLNRAYFLLVGIVLLVMVIVVEEYFKKGIATGTLAKRVSLVFGVEFLCLFVSILISLLIFGFSPILFGILALLLACGIAMVWLSRRIQVKAQDI